MANQIEFNGKVYASPEEMPADERQRYQAVMQRLVPLLEGANGSEASAPSETNILPGVHTSVQTRIVVNDRTYKSADELPPELRQELGEAMFKAGVSGAGSGKRVTLSLVSGGPAGRGRSSPGAPSPGAQPGAPDPGTIRVELNIGRTLLAVASVIALVAVAWFLFGPRPH